MYIYSLCAKVGLYTHIVWCSSLWICPSRIPMAPVIPTFPGQIGTQRIGWAFKVTSEFCRKTWGFERKIDNVIFPLMKTSSSTRSTRMPIEFLLHIQNDVFVTTATSGLKSSTIRLFPGFVQRQDDWLLETSTVDHLVETNRTTTAAFFLWPQVVGRAGRVSMDSDHCAQAQPVRETLVKCG